MRRVLLWASRNPFLAGRVPRYGFVRRAVRRFMPGESSAEALAAAAELGARGMSTILTLLGENVTNAAEADLVVEHYLGLLGDVRQRGLDVEVSVKPTQLGLDLGKAVAARNLDALLRAAAPGDGVLWIDMESSAYTDATLELYRQARGAHERVGVCLQAYLRRTPADLDALLPLEPTIRLVKGAYAEPAQIAFPAKSDVDAAYMTLTRRLLAACADGRAGRAAIATHDRRIVREVEGLCDELGLGPGRCEFSMLYGIGTAEQARLAGGGRPMRVLISYGSAWFPWYMRRLAERPANLWFVARSMFARS